MESNRKEDSRVEKLVNEYFDKYLVKKGAFDKFVWKSDTRNQFSGTDARVTLNEHNIQNASVDLKSASTCMTWRLPTFALELSSLDKNWQEHVGWLINESLSTEYYLLLYPRSEMKKIQNCDEIDYIEYYLVKKSDILDYLAENGYTKEKLKEASDELIDEYKKYGADERGRRYKYTGNKDFKFCLSANLAERPVNVVINRNIYEKYAIIKGKFEKS